MKNLSKNNTTIVPVRNWPEAKEEIAVWFHERWHIPLEAYRESITDCLGKETGIPQWYVVVRGGKIIAGCGVIENDFHERKDLTPNVCAVYVDEEYRNQGIAGFMLQYVCNDMLAMGIDTLYLLTDHTGFYERYGWQFLCKVRGNDGEMSRMYVHQIAHRDDWKTEAMPKQHETFVLNRSFNDVEMYALRCGNIPQAMEDKWFWYMEGSTLWAHRSWTGYCIYQIDFKEDDHHIVTVNRDPEQYECTSIDKDIASLNKLLDWWTQTPYDHYHEWLSEIIDQL